MLKPVTNLAELRAIHASGERGMDVPMMGGMKPLRPGALAAPKIPKASTPKAMKPFKPFGKRKYYGE